MIDINLIREKPEYVKEALAKKMWDNPTKYCEGWNFGPEADSVLTVWEVATAIIENFGFGELKDVSDP